MKKKQLNAKLNLNKERISNLNEIKGGLVTAECTNKCSVIDDCPSYPGDCPSVECSYPADCTTNQYYTWVCKIFNNI